MDLVLNEEQEALVEAARRFLARHCPASAVRQIEGSPTGHDPDLWRRAAELGWPGLVLPEACGGSGQELLELALLARELGRVAYTSPLLGSTTLVALPLAWAPERAPARRWLAGLADGSLIGAAALLEARPADEWSATRSPETLRGLPVKGGWALRGTKTLVPFAQVADVLLVSADLEGPGPALVLIRRDQPGVVLRRQSVLGGEPMYAVSIDLALTEEDLVAGGAPAVELAHRALDHAAVAATAYAAGLAAGALELSVEHAAGREQFGRPIGSFQAVAHRCAEMRAELDALELLAYQAAWGLAHDPAPELSVAVAKGYANDAIRRIFVHAHQVHGAIGFTLEHDLQLFTRRAKAFELSLGGTDRHRERVATAMGL